MIHQNVQFGDIKTNVIDFGNIKLEMLVAECEDYKSLMLKKVPKNKTGEVEYKTSDDFNPELVMVFRNRKSIENLIETLYECRNLFELPKGKITIK
ncbi:hypothetical protein [Christiangramia sp.]|uniref:hypothetical protein n=1 Tax=Christiangramia sp. TaxID=1931228 RepID=UPI002628E1F4|nr:hypothetical protein [Christiangramia sp.]